MLSAKTKVHEIDAGYDHQSKLIQKAKAEWTKRNMPKESKTEGGGSKYSSLLLLFGRRILVVWWGWEEGGRKSACAAAAGISGMRIMKVLCDLVGKEGGDTSWTNRGFSAQEVIVDAHPV